MAAIALSEPVPARKTRPLPASNALRLEEIALAYADASGVSQQVLAIDTWAVESGSAIGITGPSGSGKTSLLYVASGIALPDRGSVRWGEIALTGLEESARDRWRRQSVGFVFQDFFLFQGLSALQNVMLPASFGRLPASFARPEARAKELLDRFGIAHPHRDTQRMSRGERQRVALARALLFAPLIVLADEPTASLDKRTGAEIAELLIGLCRENASTLIAVSHDPDLLQRLDATYRLENGSLSPTRGSGAP